MQARGVVDAAQAVARVGVAGAWRRARVRVPAAVARQADAVGVVEAIAALLAVGAAVLGLALVAHWSAALVWGRRSSAETGHVNDVLQMT